MRFELGNGEIVTGFKALKAWSLVLLLCVLGVSVLVGIFFLKTYRWGNCG